MKRTQITVEKIKSYIDLARGMTLDAIEQELSDSPNWPYLRSRLLKIFGDRGLGGQIISLILDSDCDE